MIDLVRLRENPDQVKKALEKKDPSYPFSRFEQLDKEVRELGASVDELRQKKNDLAKQGKSGVTKELIEESKKVGADLKAKEELLKAHESEFQELYLRAPNLPAEDVPAGGKEANKVVRVVGKEPSFNFPVKDHLELGNELGWFDFQVAAAMSGNNFALYKGQAVSLIYSLMMYMMKHNASRGFNYVLPPYLVNSKSLEISGNFPKFKDDVYATNDDLYLIPTAEVALANMYRDTIFSPEQLPLRLTAATSCFRREAGGYGAQEKGLIRMHQFEKVELFAYCEPHESDKQLDYMVETAEQILQQLGLHYRVTLLAAQDMSFQAAKTYDIELWMPSKQQFVEVSSCSNCTDFQSHRGLMRYRKEAGEKTQYVHTLNASSLALPRLMAALMETYQTKEGTIELPSFLTKFCVY